MVRFLNFFLLLLVVSCSCPKILPCVEKSVVTIRNRPDTFFLSKPLVTVIDTVQCPASDTPSVFFKTLPCDCAPPILIYKKDSTIITLEDSTRLKAARDTIEQLRKQMIGFKEVKKTAKTRWWLIVGISLLALFFAYIIIKVLKISSFKLNK